MTDKEKIIAYIDKLLEKYPKNYYLLTVAEFIESLQDEHVSNDLEEAAHLYVDTTIECFDSEGNPCCYPAFIAGAQWQKKQMVEEACKWLELHDSYAVPTNIKVRDLKEHLSSK